MTPSQRISSKPYDVWAMIENDSNERPGGTIKNCHCTCKAVLYGACNHICGMLFHVEAVVMTDITRPTCTDRLGKWNVPSAKTQLHPSLVAELVFTKDHYRTFASADQDSQASHLKARQSFPPMTVEQKKYISDEVKVHQDLHKLIKQNAPKSCFAELI